MDASRPLHTTVQRNGGKPFELHVAIDIMLQIANAMQYFPNKKPRKIVHKDLKMTNILMQPNTNILEGYVHVKLVEFGTSKFYDMFFCMVVHGPSQKQF
jgi:serine/threonine protein kinase